MSRAVYNYNSVDWNAMFYYDPTSKSGLRWKADRYFGVNLKAKAGGEAGNVHHDPNKNTYYATVSNGGKNYFAHRVIWIMFNGYLNNNVVIDHIDGNSLNNCISNLRVVKQLFNNRNTSLRKDNSSGMCGVGFTKVSDRRGGYHTYITARWKESKDGITKSLSKHFQVSIYGLLPAFAMACKYREEKIAELNTLGYGYTEKHGK